MNPLADVWFGAKVESHEIAGRRGLLQVYQSRAAVGDEFKDPEGYWTRFYLNPLALGVAVTIQKERRLAAPASWQDLLRPDLKDQIQMPPPGRIWDDTAHYCHACFCFGGGTRV